MLVADTGSVELLAAGVDWITMTSPADGRDMQLLVAADAILAKEEACGNKLSRLRWQSYDLKKCGGVSAGLREDGAIVRLSGQTAATHWRGLLPYARNVSRLDVQCTVRPIPARPDLAAAHLREALAWSEGRDRAPKISYVGSRNGIECVYLGSRSSEAFGRVYDKYAESDDDDYRGAWRYEVEAKGDLAGHLARAIRNEHDDVRACGVFVHDFYGQRGIRAIYQRGRGIVSGACKRTPTDDERRLKWLADQVAPAVIELSQHGKRIEALLALGLAELAKHVDAARPPPVAGQLDPHIAQRNGAEPAALGGRQGEE